MTKIDIFSGFLGAGKTTLIKKLIKEAYKGEQLVLIENEFGDIGIDGGFMKESGIEITEMNSGCICCSLVGDFAKALKEVLEKFHPDRIIIEPSGVGKLSDVITAVQNATDDKVVLNGFTTVVDATKCRLYMKNFGEFFNNQVENASCIILSRTKNMSEQKLEECVSMLREHNKTASIVTTDWDLIDGKTILNTMEKKNTLQAELDHLKEEAEHEHHHHHHDDDHDCCFHDHEHEHHHDHDDDDDDCCCHDHEHEHHHDDDDDDDCCCHDHEHEHHHDDDDDDDCCCHDHEHEHHHDDDDHDCCCHGHDHHHHHADEVFVSWGLETPHKFTEQELKDKLEQLEDEKKYGSVLRAKGIVAATEGNWIHFDYVPGETDIRRGSAETIGRLCVIGSKLNEDALKSLFGV